MREKVTGKLLSLDRALEPTLPVFLSLLDVPVEESWGCHQSATNGPQRGYWRAPGTPHVRQSRVRKCAKGPEN